MQCNWYEYLKNLIVSESDIDLLQPVRRSFYHGQVQFAFAVELITKEQFVELESLIVRSVRGYKKDNECEGGECL